MDILLLKGFNNYFNRIVKKYSTLQDYKTNSTSFYDFSGINFNPNDGVVTELILGSPAQQESGAPLAWDQLGTPDYLICSETVNNTTTIKFRWFVLESVKLRDGQYRLALKRDVVADNFNSILNASCFIEKGKVINELDPLLFNNEQMTFNQIKQNEIKLFDETGCPWIVGYIASNSLESEDTLLTTFTGITLNSQGAKSATTVYTGSPGKDVCKIILELDNGGMSWEATPYNTQISSYDFQASYDYSSGAVTYRINIGQNWANYAVHIEVYYSKGKQVATSIRHNPSDYIEASSLPWTFNPNANYMNCLTGYTVKNTFVNRIMDSSRQYTQYRYIWLDQKWNINSDTSQSNAGTTLLKGNVSNVPTGFDITNNYRIYTNNNSSGGSGNWDTYGQDNTAKQASVYAFKFTTQQIVDCLNGHGYATESSLPDFSLYHNKIIKYAGHYYKFQYNNLISGNTRSLSITNAPTQTYDQALVSAYVSASSSFANYYNNRLSYSFNLSLTDHNASLWSLEFDAFYDTAYFTITEVSFDTDVSVNIPGDSVRTHLLDAPFDMFAIPYGSVHVQPTSVLSSEFTNDKDIAMAIALEIAKDIGTAKVYDIQLLPYCPVRNFISSGKILGTLGAQGRDWSAILEYDPVLNTTTQKSIILWGSQSNMTFDIPLSLSIPSYTENTILDKKICNETMLYRIVSPNYAGQFEFSLAKNDGLTKFNVDLTCKPYNPYIHINPDFKGLYGDDWDDARGLICGGDFSLPIISDAWTDYQVANKNYQEIFDRQIQNMDVNNQIAQEQLSWQKFTSAIGGSVGGGVGGALAGAKAGPWGALAGAVLGTVGGLATSIIGGELDQDWLTRQQREARGYAIDMYGYNIGNIQALPYSLTKTSALTYNNKLVPILEVYSSTDEEKEILVQKLDKDGMTIMAISSINNYWDRSSNLNFIRGSLIRFEDLVDDFHIADAIYQEIQKGVYLTPGLE